MLCKKFSSGTVNSITRVTFKRANGLILKGFYEGKSYVKSFVFVLPILNYPLAETKWKGVLWWA